MSAGMSIGIGKSSKNEIPNILEITRQAEKLGLTPEIKDLVDDVEELRTRIRRKNFELTLLEVTAMESLDENIADLREQLFTAVKLIHGEEIEEILNDGHTMDRFSVGEGHSFDNRVMMEPTTPQERLKNNILGRLRRNWKNYQELRKEVQLTKKNWKRNKTEDEFMDGNDTDTKVDSGW